MKGRGILNESWVGKIPPLDDNGQHKAEISSVYRKENCRDETTHAVFALVTFCFIQKHLHVVILLEIKELKWKLLSWIDQILTDFFCSKVQECVLYRGL